MCSAIRDLVSTGHTLLLSEEQVDNIAKSLATPDERKALLAYTSSHPQVAPADPPSTEGPQAIVPVLGAPEQLLIGLMTIPMLEDKLSSVRLVRSFRPRLQTATQTASTLSSACKVGINLEVSIFKSKCGWNLERTHLGNTVEFILYGNGYPWTLLMNVSPLDMRYSMARGATDLIIIQFRSCKTTRL